MNYIATLLLSFILCCTFIYSRISIFKTIKNSASNEVRRSKKKIGSIIDYFILDCAKYILLLSISTYVVVKKLSNPYSILLGISNIYFQNIANGFGLVLYLLAVGIGIKSLWEVIEVVHESIKRKRIKVYKSSQSNRNAANSQFEGKTTT